MSGGSRRIRTGAIAGAMALLTAGMAVAVALPGGAAARGLTSVFTIYEPDPVVIPNGAGAARIAFEDPNGGQADTVTVGLRVRHERTQQLNLSVRDPDGERVSLSEGDTRGENLGISPCPDPEPSPPVENFTSFRDTGASPIASASAPYVGYFLPREPLSALAGDYPPGSFTLIVKDTRGGVSGKLLCAYLRITDAP
ncbi:MAG: hypothetical protein ACR2G3_07385 [Solirubrobacterales bacterium]